MIEPLTNTDAFIAIALITAALYQFDKAVTQFIRRKK